VNQLTVILPCYNSEKYISQSIKSILNQTFKHFKLIIINDGSTDNTLKIIKSFKDKRIKLINNKGNKGLIYSLNRGISHANSIYLARMDGDDICERSRFKNQINFLNKHSAVHVIGSAINLIDKNGNKIQTTTYPLDDYLIKWKMLFSCPIAHPSVMMRSSIFKKVKGYNYKYKLAEDYYLWSRLFLEDKKFYNLKYPLLNLRKHGANVTEKNLVFHINQSLKISKNLISNFINLKRNNLNQELLKCLFTNGKFGSKKSNNAIELIVVLLFKYKKKYQKKLKKNEIFKLKKEALVMMFKIYFRNLLIINPFLFIKCSLNVIFNGSN
jgi:glycosyltransferase involved in cell wall biosynthesis